MKFPMILIWYWMQYFLFMSWQSGCGQAAFSSQSWIIWIFNCSNYFQGLWLNKLDFLTSQTVWQSRCGKISCVPQPNKIHSIEITQCKSNLTMQSSGCGQRGPAPANLMQMCSFLTSETVWQGRCGKILCLPQPNKYISIEIIQCKS